jgi:hypothetical protein
MGIEDLVNPAVLALVIGVCTPFKGMRKLYEAERLAAKVRCELADCEQARRELQEFAVLFNYGAREEAYDHLRACGFKTTEPGRPRGCISWTSPAVL